MICLVDTSVLCNLLGVPNRDQNRDEARRQFRNYTEEAANLLLPLACIIETGNHIAHVNTGQSRRELADKFRKMIRASLDGTSPWTPIHFFDDAWIRAWIDEFPDFAMRAIGLGDLSIIREFEQQRRRHQGHRVLIWSYDDHLRGYDTGVR